MSFSNNTYVFPILRLPAEIRFMICRESCAHLADPEHEDPDNDEMKDNNSDSCIDDDVYESDSEDLDLTNDQLQMVTTLRNLANSCHQIRDELTGEFFTRILSKTQVHLGDVYPARRGPRRRFPAPRHKVSRLSLINRKISDVLRSSSLFAKHIQHVSVHWDGCHCKERTFIQPSHMPGWPSARTSRHWRWLLRVRKAR